MASIHDKYDSWFATYLEPRYPELVAPLRAALDAYDRIQRQKRIDSADLQPIVDVARSHRRPLYENASNLLEALTADHREARDAVAEMAKDRKAQVRFNAIICLGRRTPREFCVNLLCQALSDKSARVRQKAADWAQRLDLSEIVPDLERALSNETHAGAKRTIEFGLRLMRDGYILDDRVPIAFRSPFPPDTESPGAGSHAKNSMPRVSRLSSRKSRRNIGEVAECAAEPGDALERLSP